MSVTIKEVSQLAGVATSTASYVLSGKGDTMKISGKTQKRVMSAAKKLNYRTNLVAKSLRQKQTRSIGVSIYDLTSSWANEIMFGINEVLSEAEYHPMLAVNFWETANERKNIQTFLDSRVEGLIIQPNPSNVEYYNRLRNDLDIPLVFIGETLMNSPIPAFMLDARQAGIDQIDHLYKQGHRRIAVITMDHQGFQTQMRCQGALDRIQELGLEFPLEYLRTTKIADPEGDKAQATALMQLPLPPTAIAIANDIIATRVMSGLHQNGNQDIAVIGIGNFPESDYDMISLTSVAEPRLEIGRGAAAGLFDIISNKGEGKSKLFKGNIIARKSTEIK